MGAGALILVGINREILAKPSRHFLEEGRVIHGLLNSSLWVIAANRYMGVKCAKNS